MTHGMETVAVEAVFGLGQCKRVWATIFAWFFVVWCVMLCEYWIQGLSGQLSRLGAHYVLWTVKLVSVRLTLYHSKIIYQYNLEVTKTLCHNIHGDAVSYKKKISPKIIMLIRTYALTLGRQWYDIHANACKIGNL